jgi:hypothetical protein
MRYYTHFKIDKYFAALCLSRYLMLVLVVTPVAAIHINGATLF